MIVLIVVYFYKALLENVLKYCMLLKHCIEEVAIALLGK